MNTLKIWQKLSAQPGGKWAFSKALCLKAPYFSSIKPHFDELRPNFCQVSMKKRRAVLNHLDTVHAIAMCNMAELAGGTMTEVTVPTSHRWIPKGMQVEYIKKATTDLVAIARPVQEIDWSQAGEYIVHVDILDQAKEIVFKADIRMWVSPKKQ